MKRLTLMRHADAHWKDPGVPDIERPLSRRGAAAAGTMGRRLLELELVPDLLIASPARRTHHTAEIVARELALPVRRVLREEALYLASAHDTLRTVHGSGPRIAHLLVVGHNPGLSELVQLLVPEDDRGLATAAVCSIAFDCDSWSGVCAANVRHITREAPPARLFGLFGSSG
jgi:phosphohistidine phosphatase